ncbi:MAG: hypothetical protein QM674_01640 [Burkholderiaceae bacterium]
MLSFLVLAWSTGGYNSQVNRVIMADIIALICLIIGVATYAYSSHDG